MGGPGGRKLCSVSVDLDPIACYYRIHALGAHPPELGDLILRRSVPRFLETFARHGVRGTFFLVGSDLESPSARALAREIAQAGHELANHSYTHPYELARLPRARVSEEIGRAHGAIGDAAGRAPLGFRAPGYDLSPDMLDELSRLGYRYDSSVFPAPGYYAAKAAVVAALRLTGRKSGAVLTDPRALFAPGDPYRPDPRAPWRRGQSPVVELPIGVTPRARVPVIGTNLILAPTSLRARWLDAMERRPFFNLELHGIDLCDADEDGIPLELVTRQPDLRRPLKDKRRAFEATLGRLSLDYTFLPLESVATLLQRDGHL
jgi:hypothetical protein